MKGRVHSKVDDALGEVAGKVEGEVGGKVVGPFTLPPTPSSHARKLALTSSLPRAPDARASTCSDVEREK